MDLSIHSHLWLVITALDSTVQRTDLSNNDLGKERENNILGSWVSDRMLDAFVIREIGVPSSLLGARDGFIISGEKYFSETPMGG